MYRAHFEYKNLCFKLQKSAKHDITSAFMCQKKVYTKLHKIPSYKPEILNYIGLHLISLNDIKDLKAYNSLNANIMSCELKLW